MINYKGFECEKNNGIYTKCQNGHIYTIIQITHKNYNCYYDDNLCCKYIEGLQNAINFFDNLGG